MWRKDNVTAQQGAWLIVAASGPMLSLVGRNPAGNVLAAAVACGLLCLLVLRCKVKPGKWLSLLQIVSTTILLGCIAGRSATCWEYDSDLPIIPWVLLIMAAFSARTGGGRARRAGSVFLWFVVPLIGIVLLAGIEELDVTKVRTTDGVVPWELIPILLLPCLRFYSADRSARITGKGIWPLGLIAVIGAFWMDAALGSQVAAQAENAFYEYSKGITLFGTAKRFEALVGCGLTVGWFAFFSYLLSIIHASGEKIGKGRGEPVIWICAGTAGSIMWKMHIPVEVAVILTLISWVFLPLLTQIIDRAKNINKPAKQP